MNQITESFVDFLKYEKRYSVHTVKAYKDDLEQFFSYLDVHFGESALNTISAAMIRSWLAGLKEKEVTSKSINRKISSLKSFFKFHLRLETIEKTPMAGIISPKAGKRLPIYVEEKDMNILLNHVQFPDDWQGKTERLLILIFYNTGVRLSELVSLNTRQVDVDARIIRVFGKGGKERLIPLSKDLENEIRQYQNGKQNADKTDCEKLLVNDSGKPIHVKYAYLAVKKWLSMVTTIEKKSPHVLRHSFATHLMNHGADLNAVKELLGHSSLAATQLYTHNSIEKLREVHKKTHPRG